MSNEGYKAFYRDVVERLVNKIKEHYGPNLVSIALFGSVARDRFTPESDIDILIVAERLPRGRLLRMRDFIEHIERDLEEKYPKKGVNRLPEISPMIKTPEEVAVGSPVFLDMTVDAKLVYDKDDFFKSYLEELREKLKRLGARKVYRGGGWYWLIKPDYELGEVIEL